jgi:hypothetical protein
MIEVDRQHSAAGLVARGARQLALELVLEPPSSRLGLVAEVIASVSPSQPSPLDIHST